MKKVFFFIGFTSIILIQIFTIYAAVNWYRKNENTDEIKKIINANKDSFNMIKNDINNWISVEPSEVSITEEDNINVTDNIIKLSNNKYENYQYYYPTDYTTSFKVSDTNTWLKQLKIIDQARESSQLSLLDELIYIRSTKYNSKEWEMLAGKYNEEKSLIFELTSNSNVLKDESYLVIPNTNIIFNPVHTIVAINCTINGAGSIGGWKGDLIELISEMIECNTDITDENAVYQYVYTALNSENGRFNRYDLNSDILAVNLAANMSSTDYLYPIINNYFIYGPYFNQYTLFIQNEFGINNDFDKVQLRKLVNEYMKEDVLVNALMKQINIDTENNSYELIYNAFADYLYDNTEYGKITDTSEFEDIEKKSMIKIEVGKKTLSLYKEILININ